MEVAIVFIENYQHDPVTIQGLVRLLSCCRTIWRHQRAPRIQEMLDSYRNPGAHKMEVIQVCESRLRDLSQGPPADIQQVIHKMQSAMGGVRTRLKFQVACPDHFRMHLECMEGFVQHLTVREKGWIRRCCRLLKRLPPDDISQWTYLSGVARACIRHPPNKGELRLMNGHSLDEVLPTGLQLLG